MTEVFTSEEFTVWFEALDEADKEKVAYYVDLLEQKGVTLDHPYTSAVSGSRHGGGLRELRAQSKGRPLRVLYRFDARRHAIILCGGDKQGESDKAFYRRMIPIADAIYGDWLEEMKLRLPDDL